MMAIKAHQVVVLASADAVLRARLGKTLSDMRWQVWEARGGAEALAHLEEQSPDALLLDAWLPDLEVTALAEQVRQLYPEIDLLRLDAQGEPVGVRSQRRHELLHAMRENLSAPVSNSGEGWATAAAPPAQAGVFSSATEGPHKATSAALELHTEVSCSCGAAPVPVPNTPSALAIPGIVGQSGPMLELARLIRLVAPHTARVLIEGETGTGKELVAKAVHALSGRAQKPWVVLNCAAIPESLLEAELFGHTRGAFTGAVQARMGRIEAAHGGTLFLDEIGEMPLSLQSKMLRFLENGELQRVGNNETVRVDVRVIAATHQPLEQRAAEGTFRLDLFHRLAVFPLEIPSLRERMEDVPTLAEHFLSEMAKTAPRKYLSAAASDRLLQHHWPGNVRELGHVLQRATILVGDLPEISLTEIRVRHNSRL